MSAYIHPSALVNPSYQPAPFTIIDEGVAVFADVTTGSFVRIRADAKLRQGCQLGDHVTVFEGADLGAGCVVGDFSAIGPQPGWIEVPDVPEREPDVSECLPGLRVGEGTLIGCHTTILAGGEIGSECLIGDGVIIGSMCTIGDGVTIGSGAVMDAGVRLESGVEIASGTHVAAV